MPFLLMGIIALIAGGFFFRLGMKQESKETLVGAIALIIAAVVLIVLFGIFYRSATLYGP